VQTFRKKKKEKRLELFKARRKQLTIDREGIYEQTKKY
jgi:hypothetical protein